MLKRLNKVSTAALNVLGHEVVHERVQLLLAGEHPIIDHASDQVACLKLGGRGERR